MKALVSIKENGRVLEVKADDQIFSVHESMEWIDCADDLDPKDWVYNYNTKEFDKFIKETDVEIRLSVSRRIAYTPIGEQLDMIYKDIKANGTLNNESEWYKHIAKVKNAITKDNV